MPTPADPRATWARHGRAWRDPAQIAGLWQGAAAVDPGLLEARATRGWWRLLEELGITLFITREHEHLVLALRCVAGRPETSHLALPHPSGMVVDRTAGRMFLASTRNPNQVVTLKIAAGLQERDDVAARDGGGVARRRPFVPVGTALYPGSLYIHDLALIGGRLHANAAGHNAVVALGPDGAFERVWWPRCIETRGRPVFERNHIQLNSIAAGPTIRASFYTASSAAIGRRRPGHLDYAVDGEGVVFSGASRTPICLGLTRPHSARLAGGRIWLANSGYGELGYVRGATFEPVRRLGGWTRGLCIVTNVAFVATSRIIPRYARYAPGLDVARSRCAVHAVCLETGKLLGSLTWPLGNQIFAIDWMASGACGGFPFDARAGSARRSAAFFYRYAIDKGPGKR